MPLAGPDTPKHVLNQNVLYRVVAVRREVERGVGLYVWVS